MQQQTLPNNSKKRNTLLASPSSDGQIQTVIRIIPKLNHFRWPRLLDNLFLQIHSILKPNSTGFPLL